MQHPIFVDMYTSDMWRIFLEGRRKRLVVRNKCGDLSVEAAGLAHVPPCCTFLRSLPFYVFVRPVTRIRTTRTKATSARSPNAARAIIYPTHYMALLILHSGRQRGNSKLSSSTCLLPLLRTQGYN